MLIGPHRPSVLENRGNGQLSKDLWSDKVMFGTPESGVEF